MRLQRLVRAWLAWLHVRRFAEAFAEKEHTDRQKILREFAESECVYYGALCTLSIHFYNPMVAACVTFGMTEREVMKIFGNLSSLITLSVRIFPPAPCFPLCACAPAQSADRRRATR